MLRVADPDGPEPGPGQFAMLAAAERWGGGEDERPYLPRAFSVARRRDGEAHFLLEDVGPGTRRLCELRDGRRAVGARAARHGLRAAAATAGARSSSAAAWASRRWRSCRTRSRPTAHRATVLLGFRDGARARARRCCAARAWPPTTARSATTASSPTCSPRSSSATRAPIVYACGPAPMLEAVRALCAARDVPAQLALEAGMACGFGACFGCVVPRRGGGYLRVCVDGPVIDAAELERVDAHAGAPGVSVEFCGLALAHPVINGSGTFDAIAARRAFGEALRARASRSPRSSPRRSRCSPRAGNPPPRLWEAPGGLINSIGLPNKGLEGYLAEDLPAQLAPTLRCRVPLITNVMGSTATEISALVAACDERAEIAAIELNVSCPNVKTGLDIGADPRQLRGGRARRARAHAQAADRQADAEHRRRAPRARAAAEEGGADAVSLINTLRAMALAPDARDRGAAPVAGRRHRRPVRAGDPRRRARPGGRRRRARGDPGGRHGRRAERARTRGTCSTSARRSWRSAPRAFAIPLPARADRARAARRAR